MLFDPANNTVILCTEGMKLEAEGKNLEAAQLFQQAWDQATTDFDKFTAAHYLARQQTNAKEKLQWDELALEIALRIDDEEIKTVLPSLYLNIAKGYEDLNDLVLAREYYEIALSATTSLADDEYGKMIKGGINRGLLRTATPKRYSK